MKKEKDKEEVIEEKAGEVEVNEIAPKKKSKKVDYEEKINELNSEIDKLKNDYARAYADTENTRKRLQAQAETDRKYRIQSFAIDILPVLDNLERALSQEVAKEDEAFKKGVEMTYLQLKLALEKEGVSEIDCLNKNFDANYHQAVMSEEVKDVQPGIVIEVLQKGYMLKDRILRAAMVKVSA